MNARLTARVKARNLANKMANELSRKYAEAFAPFIGKQIDKVDGDFLEKVKKIVPADPNVPGVSTYRNKTRYDLVFYVKVCVNVEGEGTCVYEEQSMYIGKLDGQVLTALTPRPDRPTDYSVEKVLALRKAYEAAKNAASEAESALFPFGEYDR